MLDTAANSNMLDLLDIILTAHHEDMDRADGVCPLVVAAFNGNTDTVRHLLDRGANIDTIKTAVRAASCDSLW